MSLGPSSWGGQLVLRLRRAGSLRPAAEEEVEQPWPYRAVAEECLLSSAKLAKAFNNLDGNLITAAAVDKSPGAAAKARSEKARSRSPIRESGTSVLPWGVSLITRRGSAHLQQQTKRATRRNQVKKKHQQTKRKGWSLKSHTRLKWSRGQEAPNGHQNQQDLLGGRLLRRHPGRGGINTAVRIETRRRKRKSIRRGEVPDTRGTTAQITIPWRPVAEGIQQKDCGFPDPSTRGGAEEVEGNFLSREGALMAEEVPPASPEWNLEEETDSGAVPSPTEVAESLRNTPKPSLPKRIEALQDSGSRVLAASLPTSSVGDRISRPRSFAGPTCQGRGAGHFDRVTGRRHLGKGEVPWSQRRVNKGEDPEVFQTEISQGAHLLQVPGEPGLHLNDFVWYPPGDFKAMLSRYAHKQVADGPAMCLKEQKEGGGRTSERPRETSAEPAEEGASPIEERLRSLRRPSALRASFGGDRDLPTTPRTEDTGRGSARDGPGRLADSYGPLVLRTAGRTPVKKEVI